MGIPVTPSVVRDERSRLCHVDGLDPPHHLVGVVCVHHEHRGSAVVETLLNLVNVRLRGLQ